MDQDIRDDTHTALVDVVILWSGHNPFVVSAESHWPIYFLRQEIQLMSSEPLYNFYFKLDNRKVRTRSEQSMTCKQCASPHILEIVESL